MTNGANHFIFKREKQYLILSTDYAMSVILYWHVWCYLQDFFFLMVQSSATFVLNFLSAIQEM